MHRHSSFSPWHSSFQYHTLLDSNDCIGISYWNHPSNNTTIAIQLIRKGRLVPTCPSCWIDRNVLILGTGYSQRLRDGHDGRFHLTMSHLDQNHHVVTDIVSTALTPMQAALDVPRHDCPPFHHVPK